MMFATILIIDPDQAMADAIAGMLARNHTTQIWRATTAADARWLWEHHRPDLVIVDPALPDEDGLALCQQMHGNPWIVATSASCNPEDEVAHLKVADMFLRKPFMPGQLLARLVALARRGKPVSGPVEPSEIAAGSVRINTMAWTAFLGEERLHLTPTEFRLLVLLVANPRQVCTHQIILDRLGYENRQDTRAQVKHWIYHLRTKIGHGAIESERELGYRFVPDAVGQHQAYEQEPDDTQAFSAETVERHPAASGTRRWHSRV